MALGIAAAAKQRHDFLKGLKGPMKPLRIADTQPQWVSQRPDPSRASQILFCILLSLMVIVSMTGLVTIWLTSE